MLDPVDKRPEASLWRQKGDTLTWGARAACFKAGAGTPGLPLVSPFTLLHSDVTLDMGPKQHSEQCPVPTHGRMLECLLSKYTNALE